MKKIINIAALALLVCMGAACTAEGDKFQSGTEVIMMTGTDSSPLVKLAVGDNPPAAYSVSVMATGKVDRDVTVSLDFQDAAALEAYNAEHGSSYQMVPASAFTTEGDVVTIEAGSAVSTVNNVTLTDFSFIENGVHYMIPVTIKSVEGSDLEVLETSRTLFIRLARTVSFYALDVDTPSISSNYVFDDDKAIELEQYTYEIKLYPYHLKSDGAEQLCRVCNWTGANEERQCMLRFNENGRPWKSLQIVTPSGGDYTTTTLFEPKQWYMLSIVYDGSTFQLYIDGEADGTTLSGDQTTKFQRFELGMSWTSYPSAQLFSGRVCEIRVWDYARSKSQIKGGLCGVGAQTEGLRAYWKMNESSGHVFHDATGNGYDMDWTKSRREVSDGAGLTPTPEAGAAVDGRWVKDEINICSE